jgi:hypothetical protein
MTALGLRPGAEAERPILGLRAVAVIGLITIALNYTILKRLLAIVETVRAGDPFVSANARRSRRDGMTWRSPSGSTTCSTIGG